MTGATTAGSRDNSGVWSSQGLVDGCWHPKPPSRAGVSATGAGVHGAIANEDCKDFCVNDHGVDFLP